MNEVSLTNKTAINFLKMINDKWRNQFYYDALNKHAKDKVVLDMGSGTGILSFYALAAGAKFVYAIERNGNAADLTYKVLKSKFDTSRFAVINCDFWKSDLDIIKHPIDILVSETVGPGLFDHGMLTTWQCIKPYLSPNAISIPDTLSFDLWVWQKQLDADFLTTLEPEQLSDKLSIDACLDQDFAEALISQNPSDVKKMRWININHIQSKPDYVYTDKVTYTMNNLPDWWCGNTTEPKILFNVDIDTPASVAIINKISFESRTLFIKDALYMPWRFNPVFNLDSAGKYNMVYNNFDPTGNRWGQEWKIL